MEFPPGDLEAPPRREPIRCADDWVTAGDRPGLGADLDPDTLQRYLYSGERARPFYPV